MNGKTTTSSLKRMVSAIMDDCVIKQLSLRGTHAKKNFTKDFNSIYNAIFNAAIKTHNNISIEIFETFLKNYFKNVNHRKTKEAKDSSENA